MYITSEISASCCTENCARTWAFVMAAPLSCVPVRNLNFASVSLGISRLAVAASSFVFASASALGPGVGVVPGMVLPRNMKKSSFKSSGSFAPSASESLPSGPAATSAARWA